MKNHKLYPIFSKPIYVNNIDYDVKKIYSQFKKTKWRNVEKNSSEKGSSSSTDLFILNKKPYREIRKHIEKHFKKYANEILEWDQNFDITTSWLTKTLCGEKSRYHNHNNCMYSGVLYLKTPKTKARIKFQNYENKRFHLIPKKYNLYNYVEFFLDTLPGDIVIFPSEVFHKIDLNETNEERISLAFNFIPVGTIGNYKSDSFCEIKSKND